LTSFFQEGNALIFAVQRGNVIKLQRDRMVYLNVCFVFYCFNGVYFGVDELEVKPLCKCENYLRTASHLIKFNLVVITFEN
jgi:hypothetical protein